MVIISKHLLIINSKCETLNTRTLQRLKVAKQVNVIGVDIEF